MDPKTRLRYFSTREYVQVRSYRERIYMLLLKERVCPRDSTCTYAPTAGESTRTYAPTEKEHVHIRSYHKGEYAHVRSYRKREYVNERVHARSLLPPKRVHARVLRSYNDELVKTCSYNKRIRPHTLLPQDRVRARTLLQRDRVHIRFYHKGQYTHVCSHRNRVHSGIRFPQS